MSPRPASEDPVELAQRLHAPLMQLIANRIEDRHELHLVARMIDALVAGVSLKLGRDGLNGTLSFDEYFAIRRALQRKLDRIPSMFGGLQT